jgi:hypothetical protein
MKAIDDENVRINLFRTAAYLKVHAAITGTYAMCKFLFKNYLHLENQEKYEADCENIGVSIGYIETDEEDVGLRLKDVDWYNQIPKEFEYKIDLLPCLSGFPKWELPKKDDKEFCLMDPPPGEVINDFQECFEKFFKKIRKPKYINYPHEEELVQPTRNKVYSEFEICEDRDDPPHRHGHFLKQDFMTGPLSRREVWLPSPEYKRSSKFWHLICEQLVKSINYTAHGKTSEEVFHMIRQRLDGDPTRTIDIKKFGLQFPREYCEIALRTICDWYPALNDEMERAISLLNSIEVDYDNHFIKPTRGTGLGYYELLKALCMYAIYDGLTMRASFADDSLIKEDDFKEAISRLEHYKILVNEKKTGKRYRNAVYFIGAMCDHEEINQLNNENSDVAAIFNCRLHWQRKMLCSNLSVGEQLTVAYHCERIFGHEFYAGEYRAHLHDGGYSHMAPEIHSGSRGAYACIGSFEHIERSSWRDTRLVEHIDNQRIDEAKKVQAIRKSRWKENICLNSYAYRMAHPLRRDARPEERINRLAKYPEWAETALLEFELTSGASIGDLDPTQVDVALSEYGMSHNPIATYIGGGYDEEMQYAIPDVCPVETHEHYTNALNARHIGLRRIPLKTKKEKEKESVEMAEFEECGLGRNFPALESYLHFDQETIETTEEDQKDILDRCKDIQIDFESVSNHESSGDETSPDLDLLEEYSLPSDTNSTENYFSDGSDEED